MNDYTFEFHHDIAVITYHNTLEAKVIIRSLNELYNVDRYQKKRKVLFDLSQNLNIKMELKELVDIREFVIQNRGEGSKGYVGICLRNHVIAGLSLILEMIMSKIDIIFKVKSSKQDLIEWLESND